MEKSPHKEMLVLSKDEIARYKRHLLVKEIGGQGQQRLKAARALAIGAGGLGSPLLMYLAAAGVGTIGIADDDRVSIDNLQRQAIFNTADAGALKAERAGKNSPLPPYLPKEIAAPGGSLSTGSGAGEKAKA